MLKFLILGSSGFIGKNFLNYIEKNKLHNKNVFAGVDKIKVSDKYFDDFKFIQSDLSDFLSLEKIILNESPDYILNFAGLFSSTTFDELLKINAGLSRNIFEILCRNKMKIKRVLLIGSAAEYGNCSSIPIKENTNLNPITEYGLSKVVQTQYSLYYMNKGVDINIARTFNIIGKGVPSILSIGNFVSQIKNLRDGDSIYAGNLNSKRDFLDTDEVIDAYWKIIISGEPNEIYNVCSGQSVSMKDILDYLIKVSGKNIIIKINPDFIKPNDILDSCGDNTKLKSDTGWTNKASIFKSASKIFS